jgi:hypothetical protein
MEKVMAYVARVRSELLALLRSVDPDGWEHAKNLSREDVVSFLVSRPHIMQGISYQILGEAGFGEGAYLQNSRDGEVYRLIRCQVSFDERGLPLTVGLIGVKNGLDNSHANFIGRIDEFTSMETGLQILGSEILDLVDQ